MNKKAIWPESLYVLIPSYKSAEPLRSFLRSLLDVVPAEKICVVDDASKDGTLELCKEMGLTFLVHTVNQGKGAALCSGFSFLTEKYSARWILTMDADGQHSPADLPSFIDLVWSEKNVGLCIGARKMKPGVMPLARICSNKLTSGFLSLITSRQILDSQCGYRLYSAELLKAITIHYKRFEMETEVIIKAAFLNFPIRFIQVQTLYLRGPSHISHALDTLRWIRAVLHIWLNLQRKRGCGQRGSEQNSVVEKTGSDKI